MRPFGAYASIDQVPWKDAVDLRIYSHAGYETVAAVGIDDDHRIVFEKLPYGTEVPVFLSLHPQALKSIADAALGVIPPSDATTAHLNDAITVRDRLLKMIERTYPE